MAIPVATQGAPAPVAAKTDVGKAPPASLHAGTQQPIPYRSEGGGAIASAGGALAIAGLLLALTVVALRIAKQRGLLDRWVVATPARAGGGPAMRVERALRVSPRTTVYRIHDAGRHFLLVESSANTTLVPIDDEHTLPETDDHDQDTR